MEGLTQGWCLEQGSATKGEDAEQRVTAWSGCEPAGGCMHCSRRSENKDWRAFQEMNRPWCSASSRWLACKSARSLWRLQLLAVPDSGRVVNTCGTASSLGENRDPGLMVTLMFSVLCAALLDLFVGE